MNYKLDTFTAWNTQEKNLLFESQYIATSLLVNVFRFKFSLLFLFKKMNEIPTRTIHFERKLFRLKFSL